MAIAAPGHRAVKDGGWVPAHGGAHRLGGARREGSRHRILSRAVGQSKNGGAGHWEGLGDQRLDCNHSSNQDQDPGLS